VNDVLAVSIIVGATAVALWLVLPRFARSPVDRVRRRLGSLMHRQAPLPEGGVHQRGIVAGGNVTARDDTGIGALQQDVHAGGDVGAVVTDSARAAASRGSPGPARMAGVSLSNVSAGRDVHVTFQGCLSAAMAPGLVAQSPGPGTHTFVGREREMAEIEALLTGATDVQLRAALDGLPGIGKTELARQVVARLAKGNKFPGGIFWFDAEHPDLRLQWVAEDRRRLRAARPRRARPLGSPAGRATRATRRGGPDRFG
jgi:hypothetical protein